MATSHVPVSGVYVYAVISGNGNIEYGTIGLDESQVYRIGDDKTAALVSRIEQLRVRPERRYLAAHNAVLHRALGETAVLPTAFGLVASSDDAVRELLQRHAQQLAKQLGRVANHVEMGLRVRWDVPNMFEYFVNMHSELRSARDALGDVKQAAHTEMLALGRLFEEMLNETRQGHLEKLEAVFARYGLSVKRNPPRNEWEVLNVACLLPKTLLDDFERIVGEAATAFDHHYTFEISGPWAPHNFTELALTL